MQSLSFDNAAALHYIHSRRCPQGGYSFYRTPEWGVEEPNAPDTFFALASLQLLGVEPLEVVRTEDWLSDLQSADGSWPTLTIGWAADAALALLERGPRHDPRAWLETLLQQRMQMGDGKRDWRGTLSSLLRLTQLLRRHAPDLLTSGQEQLERLLTASRCASGAWSVPEGDLETSGTALQLAQTVGLDIDHQALAAWWRRCEDPHLGLRLTPQAGLTSAGALHGGLIIALELKLRPRYPDAIGTQLNFLQSSTGGFGARHGALATLQATWLALVTAQQLEKLRESNYE
ncbi:MAG: hypothetical protein PHO57_06445 [Acidithiobacillus sp.]|nr:hypothetical protein [Acidithiobacillus sp.]